MVAHPCLRYVVQRVRADHYCYECHIVVMDARSGQLAQRLALHRQLGLAPTVSLSMVCILQPTLVTDTVTLAAGRGHG